VLVVRQVKRALIGIGSIGESEDEVPGSTGWSPRWPGQAASQGAV